MNKITYAKVGGPPDDWQHIEIIDKDTGNVVPEVIEVNTIERWAIVYTMIEDKVQEHWFKEEPLTTKIMGNFEIVVNHA